MRKIEELLNLETITIEDQDFNVELLTDAVEVDSGNLEQEFSRHCKLVMIAGFAYEKALAHANRLEVQLERAYASLDCQTREVFKAEGMKFTEKMVENSVIGHVEYKQLQDRVLRAQESAAMLKVARDTLNQRKDMLVSLGAQERALLNAEPSLRYNNKL